MAATTTTVTGPIETLGGSALSGKYIRFTLLTSGTETATGDLVAASTTSELLDANGDFSATLWVNGESGVESIYRIEIPGDTLVYDVIIPTSAGGGSISVETLIENHQVSGSLQQSTTLSQATAYTDSELDAFAIDPATAQVNFNATNWIADLGLDADLPTFSVPASTTISTFGASLVDDADASTARTTLGLTSVATSTLQTSVTDQDTDPVSGGAVVDYVSKTTTSVTTTTYTLLSSDDTLLCDNSSGVTVTLLAAATAGDGFEVTIKNVGSAGSVTIDGDASETIDGALTAVLTSQYESLTIVCDGSNWNII